MVDTIAYKPGREEVESGFSSNRALQITIIGGKMKRKKILSLVFVFLFLLVSIWLRAEEPKSNPVAVSPGSDTEVVSVWQSCPTFSWSAVGQASSYRIAVFETVYPKLTSYEEMAEMQSPVVSEDIPGPALSWTLSSEKRLKTGSMYAWYVQAVDANGNSLGNWSGGKIFKVEQEIRFAGIEEKLAEKMREYGVNEETINNVLTEIKLDVKEVVVRRENSNAPVKSSPEKSEVQGTEGLNTYYGQGAGYSNTSGTGATFIGVNAGYSNTTGIDNTFLGRSAGRNNTTGGNNTFTGQAAGYSNNIGSYNTFYGYSAGFQNITGNDNTFVGEAAGYNNHGNFNTFIGRGAGYYNTGGGGNIFIGKSAGNSNTIGGSNIFIGNSSGYNSDTADGNIFIGEQAGYYNTTGVDNIFIGMASGNKNTTGTGNIFLGDSSGFYNTTGNNNTFLGDYTGNFNTTGRNNTFIGAGAGRSNVEGFGNVFLGCHAGYLETGSNKLYIANSDTSSPLIYGEFDNSIVTINGKLGVGTKTPDYPMELETTGQNAALITKRTDGATNFMSATAAYAQFGAVSNHPVRILVNSTWKMKINTDGSLSMANGATCTTGGVWTNASSRSLKENIQFLSTDEAMDALNKLNPVKYNYKVDETDRHVGFIAEDVPDLVATADRKGLSPMDITAVLSRVVQEQQKMIREQQQVNREYKKIISDLQERIERIEKDR
jgi:hypothetical protein